MKSEKISIIIPVYNEEEAIGEVIDELNETMGKTSYQYEIIVVDDYSQDRTRDIVRKKSVKLIEHLENKGVGRARKTGILASSGDIIVMIDGDGSYDASAIPELLQYLPKYDMVVGVRKSEAGSLLWLRKPTKFVLRKLGEYITHKPIPDLNSGLRAFKKELALNFSKILPDGHSWVSTITIASLAEGFDVKYVPIDYHKRRGKSTFHPIKDTFAYFLLIFKTIMYFKPLRIFFPLALLLIVGGFVRTVYDAKVLMHIKESDVIIMLTGILVLGLGLLADLIVSRR